MEKYREIEKLQSAGVNKPIARSMTIGCVLFIILLCVALGVACHFTFRRALYQRYEAYITDILRYVDTTIDDDDLINCINTLERSPKYDALEHFMDGIKEDFSLHYLYIIKPLNTNDTGNVMSVVSAESFNDRYIDTEGNLYLGWISDDEYDAATARELFRAMGRRGITFFEEETEWGTDYTGALPLYDSKGKPYALLAVDFDITDIQKIIFTTTILTSGIILLLGIGFTFLFLLWARTKITNPIKLLEQSVIAYAKKSHGQRSTNALIFDAPKIDPDTEMGALTKAVKKMTIDMQDYLMDMLSAEKKANDFQKHAEEMTELANKDSLTGIRNKTAYDKEIEKMEWKLGIRQQDDFAIAMIDLNYLKKINDSFGHEQGNFAIKKLCDIICETFKHSPVYRIGGDEFTVILKGRDLKNLNALETSFNKKLEEESSNEDLQPWERVSAAIGIARYDKEIDGTVSNVFKRADKEMYANKIKMKAARTE